MMIATEATGQSGRAQWYLCRRFCEDAWVIGQLQMRGTTPDLGFLVTGPGFEPGKTVVGGFTDPWRNGLCERHREALFGQVLDMIMLRGPASTLLVA